MNEYETMLRDEAADVVFFSGERPLRSCGKLPEQADRVNQNLLAGARDTRASRLSPYFSSTYAEHSGKIFPQISLEISRIDAPGSRR